MKTLLSLLFPVLIILGACNTNAGENQEEQLDTYDIISPQKIDTVYAVDYVADISAINNVEIRSRVKGYLEKIHVDEGKRVKKGQLLFTISSEGYRQELLKAESNFKSAVAELKSKELELKNAELLFEREVISQTEVDMAIAKFEAAEALVEVAKSMEANAELNLSFTEIRAPFEGIVNRMHFKIGSLIDESTLMTTLSDDSQLYAYFNVSEKEYIEYSQNPELNSNEVSLILANGDMHINKGKIETIESEFDRVTGSISYRAIFENEGELLKHGSSGKVRLERNLNDALVIPQKSAFEIQDKIFVYALDKENKIGMKSFTIAQRLPHLYVIESGLDEKDKIIFEGIQDLKNGQIIHPNLRTLESVFTSEVANN